MIADHHHHIISCWVIVVYDAMALFDMGFAWHSEGISLMGHLRGVGGRPRVGVVGVNYAGCGETGLLWRAGISR